MAGNPFIQASMAGSGSAPAPAGAAPTPAPAPAVGGSSNPFIQASSSSFRPTPAAAAPQQHHGGGGIGGFLGGLVHDASHAEHWVQQKVVKAGNDIAGAPGGIISNAMPAVDEAKAVGQFLTGNIKGGVSSVNAGHKTANQDVNAYIQTYKHVAQHPLADPFMTAVSIAGLVNPIAKGLDAGMTLADTGSALSALKRLGPGAEPRMRYLTTGGDKTPLHASRQPFPRAIQYVQDKLMQHALDREAAGKGGRVTRGLASHANSRIGMAKQESARTSMNILDTHVTKLQRLANSAVRHVKGDAAKTGVPKQVLSDALRLTSNNELPENAVRFHAAQVDKHTAVVSKLEDKIAQAQESGKSDRAIAKLTAKRDMHEAAIATSHDAAARFQAVADHGVVHDTIDRNGEHHMAINPRFTRTAKLDAQIQKTAAEIDKIAKEKFGWTHEQLQQRINADNRIRAGAKSVKPTKGRLGIPNAKLLAHRQLVNDLARAHIKASAAVEDAQAMAAKHEGNMAFGLHERMKGNLADALMNKSRAADELATASDRLNKLEAKRIARMEPTGLVGGEGARPGRNYLSNAISLDAKTGKAITSTAGQMTGEAPDPFVKTGHYTGEGLRQGLVPRDTAQMVIHHTQQVYKSVNTDNFRRDVLKGGSQVKRTARDVLVKLPVQKSIRQAKAAGDYQAARDLAPGKITEEIRQALGQKVSTTDLKHGEAMGWQAWLHDQFPGLRDPKVNNVAVGTVARKGYLWVDKNVLGDIAKPVGARSFEKLGKGADELNTAVTAATVYYKLGHFATRFGTNAAALIVQGAAAPWELYHSAKMWRALDGEARMRVEAAAGQKGSLAMPSEGTMFGGKVSRAAKFGSMMWARGADSIFRFASFTYEARKMGFTTPEQLMHVVDVLEHPHDHNLNAAEWAKIDWTAKHANRAALAYDRLGSAEKAFISRAIWFYPFSKAATMFLGHTLAEHPYKSALIFGAGSQNAQNQLNILGVHPSYTFGDTPIGGGTPSMPMVFDPSTLSPYSTPANLLEEATHGGGGLAQNLNPVYSALATLFTHHNQYGQTTNNPLGSAASQIVGTIPLAQIAGAAMHPANPAKPHMYNNTVTSQLLRSVLGSWYPRQINRAVANKDYGLETTGR